MVINASDKIEKYDDMLMIRIIALVVSIAISVMCMVCGYSLIAHAEEATDIELFQYEVLHTVRSTTGQITDETYSFTANGRVAFRLSLGYGNSGYDALILAYTKETTITNIVHTNVTTLNGKTTVTTDNVLGTPLVLLQGTNNKGTSTLSNTTNIPIFSTAEEVNRYLETGDTTGQLNKPEYDIDNAELIDKSYYLTGFTGTNAISATWTGVTEPTKLPDNGDVDSEEYVQVSFGYALKTAPTQIATTEKYPELIPTSNLAFSIPYEDVSNGGETAFLRYVRVTPLYTSKAGVFGSYIIGKDSFIYFNPDGSVEKIVHGGGVTDKSHNFADDSYVSDIPTPQLANITHNGFKVQNMAFEEHQYYIDVYMESYLYGVKHEKVAGSWVCVIDTDWIYRRHTYNFDSTEKQINDSNVNIKSIFNVDNVKALTDDFLAWSEEYPEHWDLPTYSMLKASSAAKSQYALRNVYSSISDDSAETQMIHSEQGCTMYYVRFYEIENNTKKYGKWVRYVLRDGAQIVGGIVSSGQVDTDINGDTIIVDETTGRQDYENGEITYDSDKEWFELSVDQAFDKGLSTSFELFNSLFNSLGQFPQWISYTFGFMPSWVVILLGFSLVIAIVLRIAGR